MLKSLIILIIVSSSQEKLSQESDNVLNFISQAGYQGAAYHTATEDSGWIVKIHRIFPKRETTETMPVFLMHGILSNSVDYVITGKNKALAYLLADNNFDVFMGNSRGSRHSFIDRKTANYSNLWNFSFNEIGTYDVAAMIDYVLRLTGKSKLFYVGHSQGTSSLLALLSNRPEYNSKIIQAHFFSPVAFMKYLPNPFARKLVVPFIDICIKNNVKYLNFKEIVTAISPVTKVICDVSMNPFWSELCKLPFFMFTGSNKDNLEIDSDLLLYLTDHTSPFLSVQQMDHFLQLYRSGKFRKYDYGKDNVWIYGTLEPPDYILSNVKIPTYIYRATEDYLSSQKDIDHLINWLPNVKYNRIIPNYNHADFNYGSRSRQVLYYDVLHFLQSN
ncbi:unnamed protein product [Chironomus riparius]|uniref:Lipase n=1 Tax=Chironomus riparius TaxID=315576 RepID=A0A9N9RH54_9DIPT|nr:unnamed protein product [Chironomus riparius]